MVGRRGDAGVSAVVATLMMIAIAVALGAATYASMTQFRGDGGEPLALALVVSPSACGVEVVVAGAGGGGAWNDLSVHVEGASSYAITAVERTTHNATWRGADLDELHSIVGGEEIEIALPTNATGAVLLVVDEPANALAARAPLGGLPAVEPREACGG